MKPGIIGLFLALLVSPARASENVPILLRPERLYVGINRPLRLVVEDPGRAGPLTIGLVNADGNLHAEPVPVSPGVVDLTTSLEHLNKMRYAGFLQLYAGGIPVGAPVVLQPMLSRMLPVVRDAVTPAGNTYTEIIGWYDENDLDRRKAIEAGEIEGPAAQAPRRADSWLANMPADARVLSGFRVYVERDVVLRTTAGLIRIVLAPDAAPNTAWNFRHLAENGFYDGVSFHRIVPVTRAGDPFVIQGGDPSASGSGGPGYWLPIEPSTLPHDFGVISMARDMPADSAGSQFFLCLSREGTARLDGSYCAFGFAVEGGAAIEAIAATELADFDSGRPAVPPLVERAELVPSAPRAIGVQRLNGRVKKAVPVVEPPKPKPVRIPR